MQHLLLRSFKKYWRLNKLYITGPFTNLAIYKEFTSIDIWAVDVRIIALFD